MHAIDPAAFQSDLLAWYDEQARTLPWRIPPGSAATPDPYRIWLSEIMLQQTVVAAVKSYFEQFTSRWPTVEALAAAPEKDILTAWAGLGYYARARNLIACARTVAARGGFPDTEAELLTLPGIGPYTAAAIAAIAFDRPAAVVDGNIERVMARLHAVETPLPAAKPDLKAHAAGLTPAHRPGDHAQALMDLGATICRPKAAACLVCPVARHCAASGSNPERLPRKTPKAPKPQRHGIAYWLEHDGKVLLVRRPPKGLLGGMRAFPATDFVATLPTIGTNAPAVADWQPAGTVEHGFTHFRLTLHIYRAEIGANVALDGEWWPAEALREAGLPTLFGKIRKSVMNLK